MKKILDNFIDYLVNNKKMKLNTVNSYKRDIQSFFSYIGDEFVSADKLGEHFFSYIDNLKKMGRTASTVSRNIASLRSFFKYLLSENIISSEPTQKLKYEKKDTAEVEYKNLLTTDEIDRLISVTKTDDLKGYRDCAIIETLYACGLKASELLNIKISDLHFSNGYITINSGKETRYAPIYSGARKSINEYLQMSRKYLLSKNKTDLLFLNRDGMPLTRQGLWKLLKAYGKKAGINKEITPHLFRQSMAMHLVENGANINDVKELLGHKSISLTMNYIKNFKPEIVSVYEKIHPKADK